MSSLYPEKNRFFVRAAWPLSDSIAQGSSKNIYYTIGDKKVLVGLRVLHYAAQELKVSVYANPTGISGGTPISVRNFNTEDGIASVGTATKDVTYSSPGVQIDDPEYFYGEAKTSSRDSEHVQDYRQRVFGGNTSFLVLIENTSTDPSATSALVSYYLDWLEIEEDE